MNKLCGYKRRLSTNMDTCIISKTEREKRQSILQINSTDFYEKVKNWFVFKCD